MSVLLESEIDMELVVNETFLWTELPEYIVNGGIISLTKGSMPLPFFCPDPPDADAEVICDSVPLANLYSFADELLVPVEYVITT